MDSLIIYLILFAAVALMGQLFQRSTIPIALILVIFGMVLSFIPFFPEIHLDSKLVLNVFLPLLVYEISAFSSWRDMKKQMSPIALLSIGHVVFITILVALVFHALLPQMGWPLAVMLGAIISPPDSVAIIALAEKIRIPERIFIILEGEGMLNDAAALTIFRFALAAAVTHEFSFAGAFAGFVAMIIGETLYGFLIGQLLGKLRVEISNTQLHLIVSVITPFVAYIPMVELGGTGIISTAVAGFMIGNQFTLRFTSAYRLASLMFWPTLAYAIQGLIFLLVGLNMRWIFARISVIPLDSLILYLTSVIAVVVIGRFIWVYAFVIILPRILFPSIRKRDPYPPWQYPFVISWSGIRGGISMAAALAIPALTLKIDGIDLRDLLVFLVFCTILVTLVLQGLSLPFILKILGIDKIGLSERYAEHISELQARAQMIHGALDWLQKYKKEIKHDKKLAGEVAQYIHQYQIAKNELALRISEHDLNIIHYEKDETDELKEQVSLLIRILEVERSELAKLWREGKINLRTRNKLVAILDHQVHRYMV